ncbi:hypothetical protein EBS02_06310 [bacterium]|nr:hypothetical protein [bacterium]
MKEAHCDKEHLTCTLQLDSLSNNMLLNQTDGGVSQGYNYTATKTSHESTQAMITTDDPRSPWFQPNAPPALNAMLGQNNSNMTYIEGPLYKDAFCGIFFPSAHTLTNQ